MFYKRNHYQQLLSEKNNKIIYGSSAPRGRILDTNGKIIVDNVGVKTIIYNKLNNISVSDEIDIAKKLANLIDIDYGTNDEMKYFYYINNKKEIVNKLSAEIKIKYKERKISVSDYEKEKLKLITDDMINNMSEIDKKASKIYSIMSKGYNYQDKIIKKDCSDIEYSRVIEANIIGIKCEMSFKRINNYNNLLSNIIGEVGLIPSEDKDYYLKKGYALDDTVGISYLEKYYEDYLRGTKAKYKINKDNTISLISDYKEGNDLVLNIDIDIQKKVEDLLESEILKSKDYKSSRYYNGSYIILSNPTDGSIISMVGKSYNNGTFYNNEIGNINKSYTVGSVVKAATISLGYKYNIIDIGTTVYDSCVKLKNKTRKCSWKSLGRVDDLRALQESSNYYQFLIAIGLTGEVDLEDKYKERIRKGLRNVSLYGTGSYYIDKKYNASSKTGTSESIFDSDMDGKADTFATTRTFVSYMPSDKPLYSLVIVSPNIDYKESEFTRTYPINMYLSKGITKILFDN